MKDSSIVDILIENIKTDQGLLDKAQEKIDQSKQEKRDVTDRLKDYRRDVSTLLKYADDTQREKLEALGFSFTENENGINPTAQLAFDLVVKAKGKPLSNDALYKLYVATFKNKDDAYSYTEFNIKCRSLFNTQRLLRAKSKDSTSSREDMISINGSTKNMTQPASKKK